MGARSSVDGMLLRNLESFLMVWNWIFGPFVGTSGNMRWMRMGNLMIYGILRRIILHLDVVGQDNHSIMIHVNAFCCPAIDGWGVLTRYRACPFPYLC